MKRKILIITNPGEKGDEYYCNGVYVDAENYISYFTAPYGGYWSEESEILHLDKPSILQVDNEIKELGLCDFSIIVFCGHGYYSKKKESNILHLNKVEEFNSNDFRINSKKRIIILDSCRKVGEEDLSESEIFKARKYFSLLSSQKNLHPEDCKRYYNQTIDECKNQII